MDRASLSLRTEAARALAWGREAVAERDLRLLWHLGVAGTANVVAAGVDRWRPPRCWCPCCGHRSSTFLWTANRLRVSPRARCPGCGSGSRHRGLALVLDRLVEPDEAARVLHFAPEAPVTAVLDRMLPDAHQQTTDLLRPDVDLPGQDIQHLSLADDGYDLVVCNHVLEHVVDDRAAVAELARVTAPGGLALISVPGDWRREHTVTFPDTRLNGHHRDYGTDVVELLGSAFGTVDPLVFSELDVPGGGDPGLRGDDRLFACRP